MTSEDPDIEIIKARKLKELREKAAAVEKAKSTGQQKKKSARDIVSGFLYDRGDEVLNLAYMQYPAQTEAIVTRIAELMQTGEITSRISGGELLALFRSVGLNVRVNTTIKVEDKGKLISFSDKLKQQND
ncbi:MAG: double-stranded DNA-binding protein [Thaumarchaeota archaeon]|nr:MAG: double-stranded DNA-binding protein [Nitrososphaerota archaeon]